MTNFRGGKDRDDTFMGGGKADVFWFDPLDLTAGDVISGGAGKRIDTLRFTTPGAIGSAALTNVSAIERIELANGGANSLVLDNRFVASATKARVQVIGGDGDDLVYATELYDGRAIDFVSGGGTDIVFGGEGDDTYTFDVATLTSADRVFDGRGADTLILTGSGVVTSEQLYGINGIGTIALGDGGISLAISDTGILGLPDSSLTIKGGAGADTIDTSAVGYVFSLTVTAGAGDDTIVTGPSAYAANINGGAGADTISAGLATVVYDAADRSVAVTGGTLVLRGKAEIDLTRTSDQSIGDAAVVTGFTTVSAAGSKAAVTLTGGTGHSLSGGLGRDTLTGGSRIEGGKGADTMAGGAAGTTFVLNEGDVVRGETISGTDARDGLTIFGTVDIRGIAVSAIDTISFGDILNPSSGVLRADARQLETVTSIGSLYRSLVEVTMTRAGTLLPLLPPDPFWSGNVDIDVAGSAGKDRIAALGVRNVRAGAGDDVIRASGNIQGEAGDDRVTVSAFGERRIDGGDGNDTLVLNAPTPFQWSLTIDLSRRGDQLSLDGSEMQPKVSGFENIDLSASDVYDASASITGNAGANRLIGFTSSNTIRGMDGDDRITGGNSDDVLSGGAGDDILSGGSGINQLSGGAGADIFEFTATGTYTSYEVVTGSEIMDFDVAEDRLRFDRDIFKVAGRALDTRIVSDGTGSIVDADLVIATGKPLRTGDEVHAFLDKLQFGRIDHGLFVASESARGETMLFYVEGPDRYYDSVHLVTNLGKIGDPAEMLTLDLFGFI
jgi:trimeric autotransporter adhesin